MQRHHIIPQLLGLETPIGDVVPHKTPNVKHTVASIRVLQESVAMFGQYRPIIVRACDRVIFAGTGLWLAMHAAGYPTVACILLDLDEADASALSLTDNRTARLAVPNNDVILQQMEIVNKKYSSVVGWNYSEIDGMRGDTLRKSAAAIPSTKDYTSWLPAGYKR